MLSDVDMSGFAKHTPLTIRSNIEEQSKRHRRISSPPYYPRQSFREHTSKYSEHPNSSHRKRKTLESRSFEGGSRSSRDDEFAKPIFEMQPSRFQRNLPLHNIPELNPPFGKDDKQFMHFLSQLGSNNRPFGDIGFGQKSDLPSNEIKRFDTVKTLFDDNNY